MKGYNDKEDTKTDITCWVSSFYGCLNFINAMNILIAIVLVILIYSCVHHSVNIRK